MPVGILEQALLGFVVLAGVVSTVVSSLLDRFTFDQFFNLGEGLLCLGIALVLVVRTRRLQDRSWLGYGAAVSFALFGVSDFIEVRTGAWYSPWPLLLLKAACVLSLMGHLVVYMKQRPTAGHAASTWQSDTRAPTLDRTD